MRETCQAKRPVLEAAAAGPERRRASTSPFNAVVGTLLGFAATAAVAQGAASSSVSAPALAPNPYYLGVSEAFTHDSNVYRIPSGPGDSFFSTSLLGGFDQPISRQRIFGTARVSVNRYQNQTQLNNTSYNLAAGLDWATIEKLSGNLNVGLNQSLAAPAASGIAPSARRNLVQSESIDARARWGGASLLTLEGSLGYSKVDYSAPEYASSESKQDSASLGLFYRPSGLLRLGVAGRVTRTETPKALALIGGGFQANTVRSKNLDLLADYDLTGLLTTNARLSYTRQTNSDLGNADFSGLTGSLGVNYRATGKLSFNLSASRDAGLNTSPYNTYTVVQNGAIPVVIPVTGLYENNQVTNSLGLGVVYAATAKINASAGVRYSRAKLVTTISQSSNQAAPDTTDTSKIAFIGVDYAIARNWQLACNLGHENRNVSGGSNYSYTDTTVGCLAQFTWR
jgi:hypothetical protein